MTAYQYPPAASPYPVASPADPTAVMFRRSVAWILDILLFFLVAAFFGPTPLSPFALYEEVPAGFEYGDACQQISRSDEVANCQEFFGRAYYVDDTDALVASLVTIAYFLLIPGLLQGLKGFTPGKGVMGVRCVDEQGQAPGIGKALARSVLWIVDGAPWLIPLVGPIAAFSSKGHRRVGDMAAKTFVIGKADMGRPVIVPGLTTAYSAGYGIPGGYPGQPGQPGQPGPAPWDQAAPGAWGAPTSPPGSAAPPGSGVPGQPWTTPAPQGSPWGPPSTPSGPATPSGTPTPSRGWPATGDRPASATGATPSGESPAAPGGPIPLGGVGSTSPATDSAPSGETPSAGPSSSGAPGSSGTGSPSGTSPAGAGAPSSGAGVPPSGEPAPSGTGAPPSGQPAPGAAGAAGAHQQTGTGYEPQWDAARNTYILWEPNRRQWLGWDDSAKEWRPL